MNEWQAVARPGPIMGGDTARPPPQPDTRGLDFFHSDPSLQALLRLYLPEPERAHLAPVLERLGGLVGAALDDLSFAADRNPPVLRLRNRQGLDDQRVDKHPAYLAMERLAFGELALAAQSHQAALGWPQPLSPIAKYALTYLFSQSEFGLLCPVNMTDSLTRTIRRFAAPALLERYLPGLLAEDGAAQLQGAMFMTERYAGSDTGASETRAVPDVDAWRLHGDKWFCSNADADLALVLARPEGAPGGTKGLGLFLMPKALPDGRPNAYRIVRLKDKLGTRSMASGEIVLEGAKAWLVGDLGEGFKQMAEMVNQSRLSNGVRSAGMMRRALHEALAVAAGRQAFGTALLDLPLARRQLAKLILPAEEALSMMFFTGDCLARADAGDPEALLMRRILTPLLKFRACRDARKVAGDAMEMRGGCGYIEEWIEPRLLRDSHLGSIWEGTSNIVALDVLRAARRDRAHEVLGARIERLLADAPAPLRARLTERLQRCLALLDAMAKGGRAAESGARQVAGALYHVTAAALLAWEAGQLDDPIRLDLAELVLAHRLTAQDPLAGPEAAQADDDRAGRVIDALVAARRAA